MKRIFVIALFLLAFTSQNFSFDRKSIVERYTNYQCGPCATTNSTWYNATVQNLLGSNSITHVVYNVNWPGASDPMYLLNSTQNSIRWRYYGVNSVPWIVVNGTTISVDQSALVNSVNSGNAAFSPFKIVLLPERFSNNVVRVKVIIIRDSSDATVFSNDVRLKIALTEKAVSRPNGGLEAFYYNITRRMLPDALGVSINVPAPGDSVEYETVFTPNESFRQAVNFDSLQVVSFIQNETSKFIYQSEASEFVQSDNLNAAFLSDAQTGGSPFTVTFQNFSTGNDSLPITSYKWDFNNDGITDSEEPSPQYTFNDNRFYTVSLKVSNGITEYTTTIENLIYCVKPVSDILVVNGIDYSTPAYVAEMTRLYSGRAVYGDHNVDVWDLFGDEGFDYLSNSRVQRVHLVNRNIPLSAMTSYDKVIWIGNNYSGDVEFFDPATVMQYLEDGGNFLLATRLASSFLTQPLTTYAGIASFSGDSQINTLAALDSNLVNMSTTAANSLVHTFTLNASSTAIPIFKDAATNNYAGFRLQNTDHGSFIFISGRPYRYDTAASAINYNYIIDNWMTGPLNSVSADENSIPRDFGLFQNYPNPFNPSTTIRYQLPQQSRVIIKIFDVLGNELRRLVDKNSGPGTYEVYFDASGLGSGIYFCRMETGGITFSRKMILVK